MLQQDPNDDMPDRMSGWVALGGYGLAAIITFTMFYLAMPATALN
jgi:hypothetical protein